MHKKIGLLSIICVLAGCAGSVDSAGAGPQRDTTRATDRSSPAVESADPYAPASVELTLAVSDEAGDAIDVRACRVLSRNPGDFTGGRLADSRAPGCGDTRAGLTRFAVDGDSEVLFSVGALRTPGYPNYITQATTGADAMDISRVPLRLLASPNIEAAYAAAGVSALDDTMTIVVQTDVDGGLYELLMNTADQGPAPIYLDAKGAVVRSARASIAGGWVVFANVSMGMHTVSFGHAREQLERVPTMGWAGANSGSTDVWVLPGFTSLVAAIERVTR